MVKVNPNILRWARESAGLSLEEACRKLQFKDTLKKSAVERLNKLEIGETAPTRPILLNMAKQYHRPLITFYLTDPPKKSNPGQDFRTLPKNYPIKSRALVDALLRNIQVRQSIIRSGLEEEDDVELLPFVKSMQFSDGVQALVQSITRTINFKLKVFRNKLSAQEAFGYLRSCVESAGIYVILISDLGSHHTRFGLESFRGFALADEIAPFIVINDQDSKAAWSFTLIHEITHIFLGQTGISNQNFDQNIEKFCNDVASQILLPESVLLTVDVNLPNNLEEIVKNITEFAVKRNISSSLVAYKLLRDGSITQGTWNKINIKYISLWNKSKETQRIKSRGKKGGPDYYIVHRYMVGKNLISTVKRMMADGSLTTSKAGKILGVKAKNVQKLMEINGFTNTSRIS